MAPFRDPDPEVRKPWQVSRSAIGCDLQHSSNPFGANERERSGYLQPPQLEPNPVECDLGASPIAWCVSVAIVYSIGVASVIGAARHFHPQWFKPNASCAPAVSVQELAPALTKTAQAATEAVAAGVQ